MKYFWDENKYCSNSTFYSRVYSQISIFLSLQLKSTLNIFGMIINIVPTLHFIYVCIFKYLFFITSTEKYFQFRVPGTTIKDK